MVGHEFRVRHVDVRNASFIGFVLGSLSLSNQLSSVQLPKALPLFILFGCHMMEGFIFILQVRVGRPRGQPPSLWWQS